VQKGEFKIVKRPVKNIADKSFVVYRKNRALSTSAEGFLSLLRRSRPRPAEGRRKKRPDKIAEASAITPADRQ
jgi:hypothetical protein